MGRDRTSTTIISDGMFQVHVDKDHLGFYRGHQAMGNGYRGWHYHVESSVLTQVEILILLEMALISKGAKFVNVDRNSLYIGSIDRNPPLYRAWTLNERTCVLWIGRHGKLHIEANKNKTYSKCILKKDDLVRTVNGWAEILENGHCVFFKGELEHELTVDCEHCAYLSQNNCQIDGIKNKLENEMASNLELTTGGDGECANV